MWPRAWLTLPLPPPATLSFESGPEQDVRVLPQSPSCPSDGLFARLRAVEQT